MYENICSLPLTSDLLSQDIHPTLPLVAVGLASGHVQTYKLPPTSENPGLSAEEEVEDSLSPPETAGYVGGSALGLSGRLKRRRSSIASESGLGEIETGWRTRRHKGSCRIVRFGATGGLEGSGNDNGLIYSAGTDGLVKVANVEDGRVVMKLAIPQVGSKTDAPSLLYPSTPQTLLLATDSSALHLYDLRVRNSSDPSKSTTNTTSRPSQTFHPHSDFISSLNPLPGASQTTQARQFLTTGSTTLAITDIRKGVLIQSEEQQDELTASLFIDNSSSSSSAKAGSVVVADVGGSLSFWKQGQWQDHSERLPVDRNGEPLESLALVPEVSSGPLFGKGQVVGVGLSDGMVRFVSLRTKKVVAEADVNHDDLDGVVGLGFDQVGRMVSGGGRVLKIWREADVGTEGLGNANGNGNGVDSADESQEDDSSEEEVKQKSKKRKRNRGSKAGGNPALDFRLE